MQVVGLIAGNGSFPALFIKEASRRGVRVFTSALTGEADEKAVAGSERTEWINIGKVGRIISFFLKNGINEVCLCGQVKHTRLFTEVKLDLAAIRLLRYASDKRADTLLSAFCSELERSGIKVLSSVTFLEDYLVKPGAMTKRKPSSSEMKDIQFGRKIADEIARLRLGQTVVVKNGAVIAVEGFEGTDECIRRAGKYAGPGACLVKVARPLQDLRYDVPVFGPETVKTMIESGVAVCGLSSGNTLVIEPEKTRSLAEGSRIAVWGLQKI